MYDIHDKESAIRAIQRFLLELHYYSDRIPHVTIDGIYGKATREAIRIYQELTGLPVTGKVDYTTWEQLYRDYTRARRKRKAESLVPPDAKLPAAMGDHGEGIVNLQRLMNDLAERYELGIRSDTGGIYSYATATLANKIRRIYRLPENGTVDGEFYEKMMRDQQTPAIHT